jgi:hypothetical protein
LAYSNACWTCTSYKNFVTFLEKGDGFNFLRLIKLNALELLRLSFGNHEMKFYCPILKFPTTTSICKRHFPSAGPQSMVMGTVAQIRKQYIPYWLPRLLKTKFTY